MRIIQLLILGLLEPRCLFSLLTPMRMASGKCWRELPMKSNHPPLIRQAAAQANPDARIRFSV